MKIAVIYPRNDQLLEQWNELQGEDLDSGDFADWFMEFGQALIEEVLISRKVPRDTWKEKEEE